MTVLIEPDTADEDATYPLLSSISGRGYVLYAPYVLPNGPFTARIFSADAPTRGIGAGDADGGFVLIGAQPTERQGFQTLLSANTPKLLDAAIGSRVNSLLQFYSTELGRPPLSRPTVVVAYEDRQSRRNQHPFRGDVTANGVVLLRFAGNPDELTAGATLDHYTALLAHELFHLWNRRVADHPSGEAWLHEGSAEYLSWLAAAALWPRAGSLDRRVETALRQCSMFLGGRALMTMTHRDGRLRYACGAVAQWIADVGARSDSVDKRNAFDIWRRTLLSAGDAHDYTVQDFRAAVWAYAPKTASLVDEFMANGVSWEAVAAGVTRAGAEVTASPASMSLVRLAAAQAIAISACGDFGGAGETGRRMVVTPGSPCKAFGGSPYFDRVAGVDPMADPLVFYARVKEACATQAPIELQLTLRGVTRRQEIRCTRRVEPPAPELQVVRALPTG